MQIILETKHNCKYCLGFGQTSTLTGNRIYCSCILDNVIIKYNNPDYTIMDRYTPVGPIFIKKELDQHDQKANQNQ